MKYLLVLFVLVFVGCNEPETPQEVKIVYQPVEVPKVVKCQSPTVNCNFEGKGFTPTKKLLKCVVEQKRALEICK